MQIHKSMLMADTKLFFVRSVLSAAAVVTIGITQRLSQAGNTKKLALTACMRELLAQCNPEENRTPLPLLGLSEVYI